MNLIASIIFGPVKINIIIAAIVKRTVFIFIKFLEISNKGLQLTEEIENAFLNYNVDGEILDELNEKMEEVFDQIYLLSDISRRVLLHEDE